MREVQCDKPRNNALTVVQYSNPNDNYSRSWKFHACALILRNSAPGFWASKPMNKITSRCYTCKVDDKFRKFSSFSALG